jgi:serine protease inhibitor
MSMMIFLPNNYDLDYILYRLTPEILAAAIQEGDEIEVEVKLPKFSIEKSVELRPLLQKLNLEDMFSSNADFGGFSDTTNVGFDEGIHKAKIEVDENGSIAAAATAVFGFRSGFAIEKEKFICNYPFFYMIYDHKDSVVLFAGMYRGKE